MKLTKQQLKQLIKEELAQVLREVDPLLPRQSAPETCIPADLEACAEDFRTTIALNLPKYCAKATAKNVGPIEYSCDLLTLEIAIEDIGPGLAAAEKCLDRFAKVAIEQGMKLCDSIDGVEGLDIEYEIKREHPWTHPQGVDASQPHNSTVLTFIMRNRHMRPD